MSSPSLPFAFLERLQTILPADLIAATLKSFGQLPAVCGRVNTLKVSVADFCSLLAKQQMSYDVMPWDRTALLFKNVSARALTETEWMKSGYLYLQNFSSFLPALALDPQPGERVLDLCAAPGSKTTQLAALMRNQGRITAVEVVKDRFFRLRSVCEMLGATNVDFKLMDGRRFRFQGEFFDRVLVDAPCSSEGRFNVTDPKSYAYWSPRKINEMAHKQRGLLMTASHLVKPGGLLVYSTCTFAPEENEETVNWLLRKLKGSLELIPVPGAFAPMYPALLNWKSHAFSPELRHCVRVRPDSLWEGFFLACFRKN